MGVWDLLILVWVAFFLVKYFAMLMVCTSARTILRELWKPISHSSIDRTCHMDSPGIGLTVYLECHTLLGVLTGISPEGTIRDVRRRVATMVEWPEVELGSPPLAETRKS